MESQHKGLQEKVVQDTPKLYAISTGVDESIERTREHLGNLERMVGSLIGHVPMADSESKRLNAESFMGKYENQSAELVTINCRLNDLSIRLKTVLG